DGSLDSSFDGDGIVLTDLNSGSNDRGYELAIHSDGTIVVAGTSDQKLALSRYHPNGVLDSTFDYDGKLVVDNIAVDLTFYVNNNWTHPTYMKLQADGK